MGKSFKDRPDKYKYQGNKKKNKKNKPKTQQSQTWDSENTGLYCSGTDLSNT
jgi:hypothetical protein